MEKRIEKVSIVSCNSYEKSKVKKALIKSLKNLHFEIPENKTILIKPNLLSPQPPSKAITTNPVIIEELCKLLKEKNNKIIIGDSSAHDTDSALKKSGMLKLKKYGEVVNFESLDKITVNLDNKRIKQIRLPQIIFKADLIINVPKLKTHSLTRLTCCIKNLYGCIPGNTKEYYHRLIPEPLRFSRFLLEIYEKIKPELNIVDAITGMEGEGPGASGIRKKTNLIIASKNALAADVVAADIIGYKIGEVWTNSYGLKRENIKIEILGKMRKVFYKKPKTNLKMLLGIFRLIPKPKIIFYHDKCIKCGLCSRKCPMKAITLKPFPECDHKKCIRCLCCIEVCPKKAVSLEKDILRKVYEYLSSKIVKA